MEHFRSLNDNFLKYKTEFAFRFSVSNGGCIFKVLKKVPLHTEPQNHRII